MKRTAIIIEDEQPARQLVKKYLDAHDDILLLGEFADGFNGVKAINELKPDIVFLDIQMPRLTGFEVLELIEHKPLVIFTTAYDQYALKAFEVSACDYLMKPFSQERFDMAISNALDVFNEKDTSDTRVAELHKTLEEDGEKLRRIAVRTGNKVHVIAVGDIFFIEAQGDYVAVHTKSDSFLKEKPMSYYEKKLPSDTFVRIHRSYILNINVLDRLEYYDKESYVAILKNNLKLKVSKNGYKQLRDLLNL